MKHLIRSVKYFFYILVLATLALSIMVFLQGGKFDVDTLFVQGMRSVYTILGIFAFVAAFYPALAYQKRKLYTDKNFEQLKPEIERIMEAKRYRKEKDENGLITFIASSTGTRLIRMYEDRITFEYADGTITAEGHRKDLVRILPDIEELLRSE